MNRKARRAMKYGKHKRVYEKACQIEDATSNIPKKCSKCEEAFEMSSNTQINDWQIEVLSNGSISLSCPKCVDIKA